MEDIELDHDRVIRVAPRYGAIFEDRVRRRLQQSAQPALDVLADVLDQEQNLLINNRNTKLRLIVLDGPAGTGKTVVAAHRIAVVAAPESRGIYLTPNTTLRDYIKPVLPRLGLERSRVRAWSLVDVATTIWPNFAWSADLGGMVPDSPHDRHVWAETWTSLQATHPELTWEALYRESTRTLGHRTGKELGIPDIAPLLWMGAWARRTLADFTPEWIIIDEAQAIPLLAYHALRAWLGPDVSWVLAGDLMQQGSQHQSEGWLPIQEALSMKPDQFSHLWLKHSYRVPPKIHAAAERLRSAVMPAAMPSESVPWHPHAGQVTVTEVADPATMKEQVKTVVQEWQENGIRSVAILVADASQMSDWTNRLSAVGLEFQVLDGDTSYRGGLVVTTLDAVRGLEFDGVLMVDVDQAHYPETPAAARKLYTSLTRARRAVHLMTAVAPHAGPSPWLALIKEPR